MLIIHIIDVYGGVSTFVASMLAMALVALNRCLDMFWNNKWAVFCDKKRNIILLLFLAWIPSLLSIIILLILQSHRIETIWHCENGGCGFVRSCELHNGTDLLADSGDNFRNFNDGIDVWRLTYFFSICVPIYPLLIIIISYLLIWCRVHQSTKYFRDTK